MKYLLVSNQPYQVKSGKQSGGQVNIILNATLHVITSIGRISSRQNAGPGIQSGQDTGLGNGNCLLFHHLVDGGSVTFVHFVELINATHTIIKKIS